MARPKKNNCEYFSHDAGMRNHRKVKALRQKFANGYAIWSMLLEYLTDCEDNHFKKEPVEMELLSGDFGVSVTEITDVVNYCIILDMLQESDGFIRSKSLDKRLAPVYHKRDIAKQFADKQVRNNGKFTNNNADVTGVSVTEKPQSKVKESKLNKSKLNTTTITAMQPQAVVSRETKVENSKNQKNEVHTGTSNTVGNNQKETPAAPTPGDLQPEPEKEKSVFSQMMDFYFIWFEKNYFSKPKIDGGQGNALKSIIGYFGGTFKGEAGPLKDLDTLSKWKWLLDNWGKLDNFNQNKTKLTDINGNLQNLIVQIKNNTNGQTKPQGGGRNTGRNSIATSPTLNEGKGFGSFQGN